MKSKSSFYQDLWAIVLPISVQSLVSSSVGASDALMLGFTVMWVLSTMIKTWDDSVVYSVDDGTVVHTLGCDYSLGGFIEFYRLEAVCVVLGVLLAAGISLLLWRWYKRRSGNLSEKT